MTVTAQLPKHSLREFTDRCRRCRGRIVRWLVVAIGLTAAGFAAIAAAAPPSIDTIVVMLSSSPGSSGAMSKSDSDALAGSLRSQFSIVDRTREGAYVLQLQPPLPLDGARAAVNRVRLVPQVVYANVVSPPSAADPAAAKAAAAKHPPVERIIVKYRDQGITAGAIGNAPLGAPALARLGTLAGQPVSPQRAMSGGEYLVRLFQSLPVEQATALARSIATDPAIEYAVPDLRMLPLLVPNDPLYSSQWHYMSPPAEMGGVNLPPAWDITTGSASIVIAVIDTGSLPNHPDLANRYVGGYDFITDTRIANDGGGRDSDAADPGDWVTSAESAVGFFAGCAVTSSSFHGTHVAGTIGAATNNATGVAGINWVSKILPVRVLGKCGGYTSDIVDAIRWAVGLPVPGVPSNLNPARVLNMSFGGYACDGSGVCECDPASQGAIDDAVAAGAVTVVAAGNSNRPAIESSPGNCNGVITVAATGRQGQRASYSNYGPVVEIAAPGGTSGAGVLSTINTGLTSPDPSHYTYTTYQGTSMAAPHVAGIVSLMLSVNPALTPSQVTSKLSTSARAFPVGTTNDCTTALCGAGIVDAWAAVRAAVSAAPGATATLLSSSANPAGVGASVTFTATVTGTNPSGSINFTDGGTTIGTCNAVALTGSGNSRSATCSSSSLAAGTHSIVASYGGDSANAASSSTALSQVITAPSAATASFVGIDSTTQGNWKGKYGNEGYTVLGDSTSYPAYATVSPSGKADYTWAAQTTDARALQRASSGRIAACWYGDSFSVDINLTDQATHRVALYLLDWDTTSRATQVDVLDATTQQLLTTQTLSAFNSGAYLLWDLRGHVTLRVTRLGGNNAVVSGLFFDSPTPASTVSLNGTVTAGASALPGVNFSAPGGGTCSASDAQGRYACSVPQGWSGTVTPSLTGYAFTPTSRNYSSMTVNQTAQNYAAMSLAPGATATLLSSSANPAGVGASVTFTATVTGTNPSGSINFTDGGTTIGACNAVALTGSGNSRSATCSSSSLAAGTHSIVASYGGDSANAASSSTALSQVITAPSAATASFVGIDSTTQGNWKGKYGNEGYTVLGDSTSYPAYATVSPSGKADYTWAAQTTDARALQRASSGRIAACWYGDSFSVDINLTDQATHRVALYLLDWDTTSRATQVDVLDATTQQLLTTQTLSAFNSGAYLLWDLRGHVTLRVTRLGGNNAVVSGLFFDSPTPASTVSLNGTVTAGASALPGVNFSAPGGGTCSASDAQGRYACSVPQGWSGTVTPSLTGYAFTPTSRNYSSMTVNQTAQNYAAMSLAPGATATLLSSSANPAGVGASVTFTATVTGTNPSGSINFTDGGTTIGACNAVALTGSGNSRSATCSSSSLAAGTHSIVASYGGDSANAASSSTALSQVITAPSAATASFVGIDSTTQGNWKGKYGNEGYTVLGDSTSYPAYATVSPSGKADYTWAAQTTDARALQRASSGRIAACWYGDSFSVDINLTDQATHRVALYLLDWDTTSRATQVDVLDATTQQLLTTQTLSAFNSGAYLLWDLRGHVTLRVTRLGGNNAVVSGLFFDPKP